MESLSVRNYGNTFPLSYYKPERREREEITSQLRESIEKARKEYYEGKTLHFENAASAIKWMEEL